MPRSRRLPLLACLLAAGFLLALTSSALATDIVGDAGHATTIHITTLEARYGTYATSSLASPATIQVPSGVAADGTLTFPLTGLNQHIAVTPDSFGDTVNGLTYSVHDITLNMDAMATADPVAHINPLTGVVTISFAGHLGGSGSATVDASYVGSLTSSVTCNVTPPMDVDVELSSTSPGGVAYNPTTGAFTVTNTTFTVPQQDPSCVWGNAAINSIASLLLPYVTPLVLPSATAGGNSVTIAGTISPAVHAPAAPAVSVRPHISGDARETHTLTCAAGSADGVPLPTFARVWLRSGIAIPGATGATHLVVAADAGHHLTCAVTWTNVYGTAHSASSVAVPPRCVVPPVVRLTLGAAKLHIVAAHCSVGTVTLVRVGRPRGTVTAQFPHAHTALPYGALVKLSVQR
jgi:hypothetical protein